MKYDKDFKAESLILKLKESESLAKEKDNIIARFTEENKKMTFQLKEAKLNEEVS